MPYPGVPANKTAKVERCVAGRMADPNFKPRKGQTKKQSAIAVCVNSIMGNEFIGQITNTDSLKFSFGDGKYTSEIEILKTGKWNHEEYGKFEITDKDLLKFVETFGVRGGYPITVGHPKLREDGRREEIPAVGWIKNIYTKGVNSLRAFVEWTKEGYEMIKTGKHRFFSPEFNFHYRDSETGKYFSNVLIAGALTNYPYFKGLAEVMLSEEFAITSFTKGSEGGKSSDDSKAKGGENNVAKDEKEKDKSKEEPEDEKGEEDEEEVKDTEPDEAKSSKGASEDEDKDEKIEATEKTVSINASEYASMQKALKEAKELATGSARKLRKMELHERVGGYVCSESNKKGKILPKDKDGVVEFMETLTPQQEKQFFDVLDNLPESVLFSEIGANGELGTPSEKAPEGTHKETFELSEKAKALAKEKDITFGEAVERLVKDNPKFAEAVSGDYLKD